MTQLAVTTRHEPLPERWTRGRVTWLSVASLFCAYWVYSLCISPMVVPPPIEPPDGAARPPGVTPPSLNIEIAERHLSHAKWAGDAKYQLTTATSYVYAEEWKPVDSDNAVRFKPFAMVWMQKGRKPNEAPITIVAKSAYVRFARKFDIAKSDPGRVIGGSLNGRVDIRGPNGLRIIGSNFVYSEKAMRLWSDDPVQFTHGLHRGTATGLECELLRVEGSLQDGRFAVGGIKSIRLLRNVVMHLALQSQSRNGNLTSRTKRPARIGSRGRQPKKIVPVRIQSKGSFEFGALTNVATFEDEVQVVRPTKPGQYDILKCDLLTLVFEQDEQAAAKEKAERKTEVRNPEERFRTIDSKLTFRRLRAQARAPRRYVELTSQASKLTAHMSDLIHDAQSKWTKLLDPEAVQVVQDNSRTHAPEIRLGQDRKGDVTTLICKGAGWIKHFDKRTGRHDFSAIWKKSLKKYPDPKSDLDILDLEHDVVLDQPIDKSNLRAQFVRIWMDRRKSRRDKERSGLKVPAGNPREAASRIRLRRMLALNQVTMNSPDLRAYTKRLEMWFEHPQLRPIPDSARPRTELVPAVRRVGRVSSAPPGIARLPGRPVASTPASRGLPSRARRSSGFMASVEGPRFGSDSSVTGSKSPKSRHRLLAGGSKNDGPLHVWADLIRVRVVQGRGREETRAREIWTLGSVQVKQDHEPGEEPLRITGDRMHIVNGTAENDQILHVYGKPAHIRDRRMHIEGAQVNLDRAKNSSWVTGKGLLQLPVDKTLDGRKLEKPQILDVWWRKSMTFDGETARFRGQVRGVVEDSRVRCEELDVLMTERVQFGRRSGDKREAQIKQIVCRDHVQFESYEYEQSKLVQIRKGRVRSLTVDQRSGDTDAQGPGWMAIWRRSAGKRAKLRGPGLVRPNRGAARPKTSEWDYTRINFADKSLGNYRKQHTRFRNRVEVVYGPVDRPPHVIDPDELPEGGGWMRCRELLVTQHSKTKTQPDYLTLRGEGNSEIEGRGFHGRADTITYNELQDLYILRSIGRRDATIWRQTEVGGERASAEAQRWEFIPSKNSLKAVNTKRLDGLR